MAWVPRMLSELGVESLSWIEQRKTGNGLFLFEFLCCWNWKMSGWRNLSTVFDTFVSSISVHQPLSKLIDFFGKVRWPCVAAHCTSRWQGSWLPNFTVWCLLIQRIGLPNGSKSCSSWQDCGTPKQCRQETWLALQRFQNQAQLLAFPKWLQIGWENSDF